MCRWNQQPRRGISALKVLGIVFLVLILVCGGIVTYVAMNLKGWAARAMRGPLVQMIEESSLPEDQKSSIKSNINWLADDFEDGKITAKQFARIAEKLTQGPFIDLALVEAVRAKHMPTLNLPEPQQQEASLTFDRFERGVVEDKISAGQVGEVMSLVSNSEAGGKRELKEQLTETELKAFLAAMKEKADEAGIPLVPYQVDFAGQLQRAIDEVLGSAPTATSTSPAD